MRSSEAVAIVAVVLAALAGGEAEAQEPANGYAVERFVPSAPGAGWFVMDDLRIHGGLGGVIGMGLGYSHDALRLKGDDGRSFSVIRNQAFADLGLAVTYSRFRFSMNFTMPLAVSGEDGVSGGQTFIAPHVSLQTQPDTLADPRLGVDARLYGEPNSALRLGASAQLIVPSAERADYLTDGTYRAMLRLLFAGDRGIFTYAANLGVHVRGRNEGSELLFGAAGGVRLAATESMKLVVGPELWGETAFDANATGLEALVGARLEGTRARGMQLRLKAGAGAALDASFGVPEWRMLFGVEVFNHNAP